MSGEVVSLHTSVSRDIKQVRHRLQDVLALLCAIDAGELLAALPECEVERDRHLMALRLLALAEKELFSLREQLDT